MLTTRPRSTRQPSRKPWSIDRLRHERAIAIGCSIEPSTAATYSSALHSYLTFCAAHQLPNSPTPDTLSFFVVYMSHHIKPQSVDNYLSGICNQLEPYYPDVRATRRHPLVSKTLAGCKKLRAVGTHRKRPLTRDELHSITSTYIHSTSHDDLLFAAICVVAFHGLLRLGELVWPDHAALQDYRKVAMRDTANLHSDSFDFYLPGHKADRFFEGSRVLVHAQRSRDDPFAIFVRYVHSRDKLFPHHPELWLRADGHIPLRSWFMTRLRQHFLDPSIGGHSLRSGGATDLANAGVPPYLIQSIGRWASEAWRIYIRRHPALQAALLFCHR
jgi:hypothetical protein